MNLLPLRKKIRTTLRLALTIACLVAASPTLIPVTGVPRASRAAADRESTTPFLATFIGQVTNGHADQITGVYSSGILADPVVQQPVGQATYISLADGTLTQFQSASAYGSQGFLAHNDLAGKSFALLAVGDLLVLVHGDGSLSFYRVQQVRRFQAVHPGSPYSDFIDTDSSSRLAYDELFYAIYGVSGRVVLQTCINADGIGSWGRLFVIALPLTLDGVTRFPKSGAE